MSREHENNIAYHGSNLFEKERSRGYLYFGMPIIFSSLKIALIRLNFIHLIFQIAFYFVFSSRYFFKIVHALCAQLEKLMLGLSGSVV